MLILNSFATLSLVESLKLYLIEITIPSTLKNIIEYKDENDNWFETYREIEFGEPVLKKIFL